MPKLEGAAIHMQSKFESVEFLTAISSADYESFLTLSHMSPFSDEIVTYLNSLSKLLNKDPRIRLYPDVATFSFFCRKANIQKLKTKFSVDKILRLGRGAVFHIAPSNVPVNFAFSLLAGLLAGNNNIVRVPSKNFDQVNIIVEAINLLAKEPELHNISKRIILVKYDRGNIATREFSQSCDVRVIWGGDETIRQIRTNPLSPRAFDITFADRYSICAINADRYINESNPERIATGFYNDTYLFDQNACTSPHLVIWLGTKENVKLAKLRFWHLLHNMAKEKYQVQSVPAVDKITTLFSQAIMSKGDVELIDRKDNLLYRVEISDLSSDIEQYRCTGGYFSEYSSSSLMELTKIVNRKYQTLSYYGFSKLELSEFIKTARLTGIDRVTPIGKTMDFSLNWDGYNLIEILSRVIDIT